MRLDGIRKEYGGRCVLDCSFTAEEGKITAVLGESGAGKTTLLEAIAARIPFEGRVEGRGRVSYLSQQTALLPHLTAEGNLRFVLEKELWGEIPPMLAEMGLGGRENARPRQLSGGECRRVAIARALLYPHDTLLLDEPFSSLDLGLKRKLISLTASFWKQRGDTVLFVTHDVHEAALLAHRALVFRSGRIVADLPLPGEPARDFLSHSPEEDALARVLLEDPR